MDPQRHIGAIVTVKVTHVTSEAETHRCYGGLKLTTMVEGVVIEVKNGKNSTTGRVETIITANYMLTGGVIKRKRLYMKSIKLPPTYGPEVMPLGYIFRNENVINKNDTNFDKHLQATINHDNNDNFNVITTFQQLI
jgi:hypothetical protein